MFAGMNQLLGRHTIGLLLVVGLGACAVSVQSPATDGLTAAETDRYRLPEKLDDGWDTGVADVASMDPRRLEAMTGTIRRYSDWNIHAVLIERRGRLVYEEYFPGSDERWGRPLGRVVFDRQTKHDLRSVSKSVVSALVGIALATGKIRSVDQALLDFFPELSDLATPERRRLTVRHALTMSAGLEWNETLPYTDPRNDEIAMIRSTDPVRYVLGRPFVAEPAAIWNYNGGLTQLLGTIVQRASGQPLEEYARTALFGPLGIDDVEWIGDLAGVPSAASGLRLRPRDLAKIGSLYLHGGKWRDRQIVAAAWISESTLRHLPVRPGSSAFGTHGYGYQWWHTCYRTGWGTFETHTAAGNGQQRIYVVPALDLVVTILAGRYNDPTAQRLPDRLLLEHIIPAALPSRGAADRPRDTGCGD
jgi:CubicO group peptidase (beta-lactamase class C family)